MNPMQKIADYLKEKAHFQVRLDRAYTSKHRQRGSWGKKGKRSNRALEKHFAQMEVMREVIKANREFAGRVSYARRLHGRNNVRGLRAR